MNNKIPSPFTIGIIGGGQLGYMLIEAGNSMNLNYITLDALNAPCARIAMDHIDGSISNADDIKALASQSDVVTFEIEHINLSALEEIEAAGKQVIPSSRTLAIIKDKGIQKQFYQKHDIPTSDFGVARNAAEWDHILARLNISDRFVIKTCTGGYDGKGVQLASLAELHELKNIYSHTPVVLEAYIDFVKELSVIVARGSDGNSVVYDAVEMVFDPKLNLVDTLIAPANITQSVAENAKQIALQVVDQLADAGLYAIEMFLDESGNIYVNETAPRPHNSGHHTIEACITSQYQQLNRILMGWPLGSTQAYKVAAMINLIGPEDVYGAYALANTSELLAMNEVFIHMYGKTETRPGRKLGHITLLADSNDQLHNKITTVKKYILIEAV